jgi:hypothetical protein
MTGGLKSLVVEPPRTSPDIYECGGRYKDICECPGGTTDPNKLKTVGKYDDGPDMCKSCANEYENRRQRRQGGGGRRGKRRKSKNRKSIYKGERITKKRITKKRTTKKRKTKKRKTKKRKN